MKKIGLLSLILLMGTNISHAVSMEEIPNQFNVNQHWFSYTTSFDIKHKDQKIGSLYRNLLRFLLTYDFYDCNDTKQAIAQARFFSLTAYFDIYDLNDNLLGMAKEKYLSFFPTFDIISPDNKTIQASAYLNFWGTKFTVTDPTSQVVIAEMTRPFFNFKNDWNIKIINRHLLEEKNIDPNVLLTVLAFQGDREEWDFFNSSTQSSSLKLNHQIENIALRQGLSINPKISANYPLESLATRLEKEFYQTHQTPIHEMTEEEQLYELNQYFTNILESGTLSDEDKQALVYLIQNRFK